MGFDLNAELARLKSLTVGQLRQEWSRLWGEPCRSWNKPHLVRRCAWKLAHGDQGLSPEALARAKEIAAVSPVRLTVTRDFCEQVREAMTTEVPRVRDPRLPQPSTTLTRKFRGETIQVQVLERGFQWRGEVFPSLSAVATAISGSHVNGFRFFALGSREKRP